MDFKTQGTTLTIARDKPGVLELQAENTRLQRLVADLLVKNQQLRVELKAAQRAAGLPSNFGGISNN